MHLQKMNLCYCNNCSKILHDTNPQRDATFYAVNPSLVNSLDGRNVTEEGKTEYVSNCCPNCETDAYLTDDLPENELAALLQNKPSPQETI